MDFDEAGRAFYGDEVWEEMREDARVQDEEDLTTDRSDLDDVFFND